MNVVAPEQITPPPGVVMFFIAPSDGDVYRAELTGSAEMKIAELDSTNLWRDHLELRVSLEDTNYWDLAVVGDLGEAKVVWSRIS